MHVGAWWCPVSGAGGGHTSNLLFVPLPRNVLISIPFFTDFGAVLSKVSMQSGKLKENVSILTRFSFNYFYKSI